MNPEREWESELPEDLHNENYNYPPALFRDRDKVMRFEGSDDIPVPVTNSERPLIMARYAVANVVMDCQEGSLIRIARGEVERGLISSMRKVWWGQYDSCGGLEKGDIELAAEELGVYELLWPFDPDAMREEAAHVEQQFAETIAN